MSQAGSSPRRRWARAAAIIIAATLALMEALLRLIALFAGAGGGEIGHSPLRTPKTPNLQSITVGSRVLGWALLPNITNFEIRQHMVADAPVAFPVPFRVSTDARGMRVVPGAPETPAGRILAAGDSTTFGLGVCDADSWPGILQARLNAEGEGGIAVFNAGVTGYSLYQVEQKVRKLIPEIQPSTLIVTAGNNDPEQWIGGSDARRFRPAGFSALASPGARQSLLWLLAREAVSMARARGGSPERVPLDEFNRRLASIHAFCREHGVELVLVRWPWAMQIEAYRLGEDQPDHMPQLAYQEALSAYAEAHGLRCVDPLPALAASPAEHYLDGVHLDAAGNRIAAEALFEALTPREG